MILFSNETAKFGDGKSALPVNRRTRFEPIVAVVFVSRCESASRFVVKMVVVVVVVVCVCVRMQRRHRLNSPFYNVQSSR